MPALRRLLAPGAVDLVPHSVSEPEVPSLDDTFEAIPVPVPKAPPLVGATVMPLPLGKE